MRGSKPACQPTGLARRRLHRYSRRGHPGARARYRSVVPRLQLALLAALGVLLVGVLWVSSPRPPPAARPPAATALPTPAAVIPRAPDSDVADQALNPGFIGASCASDQDCRFAGGTCLPADQGWPAGHCTQVCKKVCPDRQGDQYATTFCVDDPLGNPRALCLSRCALHLSASGCRDGYVCSSTGRHGEPGTERLVCVPELGSQAPQTECTAALRARRVGFARPDLADDETRVGGARATCRLDTPVMLPSSLRNVDWREWSRRLPEALLVSCRMALALDRLSVVLEQAGVVEVEHVGTYNCRGVAGGGRLSAHGQGRAIDIRAFERATGAPVTVEGDWSGRNRESRAFLHTLAERIQAAGIFSVVLTPDHNAAHKNHLHLEIAPL